MNPSGFPCNTYSIPSNVHPTSRATVSIVGRNVNLDGSTSTDDVFIMNRLWTQLTGTHIDLGIRTGKTLSLLNLSDGNYSFKYWVRDNAFAVDSIVISFTIPNQKNYLTFPRRVNIH